MGLQGQFSCCASNLIMSAQGLIHSSDVFRFLCVSCKQKRSNYNSAQGAGERCVLAARADPAGLALGSQGAVTLILCDAIGSPLGSAPVPFKPDLAPGMLAASVTHAAAASAGAVFLWRFSGGEQAPEAAQGAEERCCWVLDLTTAAGKQARA